MARRAAQGAGTIRKKTITRNGKEYTYWEARYTTGTDPGTGRQVQRSISGKTQKEVREKLQAATVQINTGTYTEPSRMTVGQWLDIWETEYLGGVKWSTQKHYKAQIRTHIKPALGAVKLSALSPHQVQRFYNQLLVDGKIEKLQEPEPLSPKSVKNIHIILSKALSVALSLGYIKYNPCTSCTLPRAEKKEIKPLTDEQVAELLKLADTDEYSHVYKVILFTGLRVGEALGLTWDCVDFNNNRLMVNKQLQKRPVDEGGYTYTSLKNDKPRVIAPAPFVMEVLKDRKCRQIEDRFKAAELWQGWGNAKEQETAAVFTNALGQHPSPKQIYLHLKKLAAKVGAPDARVHDLRHTYAVLALQNGDDVKTVQSNLGHATAAFTLDVYGHVSETMREASASRMQEYINKINQA